MRCYFRLPKPGYVTVFCTDVMLYTRSRVCDSYFRLFIDFVHISINPSFASEDGKLLIALVALSAYFCAKALVCSRPLLWDTSSRAYTAVSPVFASQYQAEVLAHSLNITLLGELASNQSPKLRDVFPGEE